MGFWQSVQGRDWILRSEVKTRVALRTLERFGSRIANRKLVVMFEKPIFKMQ